MLRVGLTGGIGSGKSAVAERLAALGAVVLDGDKAARAVVEPGTPGLAHDRLQAAEDAAVKTAGPDTIVVHDIPLLAEGQRSAEFAVVIVVDVPPEVQVSRLAGRGLPEDQARARMAAQATREQRLAIADIVIDNSGTREDLDRQVAGVWADLVSRAKTAKTADG
jgi:dephospho-CoA kinase